jgi:HD-like signal output (HDOD) protein
MSIHPLYQESIKKIESINPAIKILSQVSSLIQNPNTELRDISEIMKTDASMTSEMIKMSNSSFYGFSSRTSNIYDALSRIGLNNTNKWINILFSHSLSNKDLPYYGISTQRFWSTNVASALLMEAFAKHIGGNTNDAYSIGTLHAIGKVLINDILTLDSGYPAWNQQQPIDEWELEVVGVTHAYAGAEMLKRWDFPERIYNVIKDYISPQDDSLFMINALNFSHLILEKTNNDLSTKNWIMPEKRKFIDDYGFTDDEVRNIVSKVAKEFTEVNHSLGMDTD